MKISIDCRLFSPKFRSALYNDTRTQIYFGGSSSGKSKNISMMVPIWALEGRSILLIRQNDAHITKSIWSEVTKAISDLRLSKYFTINKSERTIISNVSKGSILFAGCMDPEKLKSITSPTSSCIDTIIVEEVTEISEPTFNQITLRQRGKSKFPKRIIMLFNPIRKTHWVYERFFKKHEQEIDFTDLSWEFKKDNLYINKSTYRDNPFLGQEEIDTIESYKEISPYHYDVYGKGYFGILSELVYESWELFDPSYLKSKTLEVRVGSDSGYQDPMVVTISFYDKIKNEIYIADGISRHRVSDLKIFATEVKQMLRKWNLSEHQIITGDSSDPRALDLLRGFGLNMRRAIKGSGSKLAGIMWLKSNKIFVNKDYTKMQECLRTYSWKQDKDGHALDDTLHELSDELDAVRYSFETEMRNQRTEVGRNNKILR